MVRILVAYATRTSTTIDVAATIAGELSRSGAEVTLTPVTDVDSLDGYDAAVIGSAIRVGAWLPEAVAFVEEHREALSAIPTAFFLTCMTLVQDTQEAYREVESYLDPVCAIVEPRAIGMFAGRNEPEQQTFLERLVSRTVRIPQGDYRDWSAIQKWGQKLLQELDLEADER